MLWTLSGFGWSIRMAKKSNQDATVEVLTRGSFNCEGGWIKLMVGNVRSHGRLS